MEETLRVQMAEASRTLHARGWVANHDGNLSARLGERFLATPTAVSKGAVRPEMLIVLDAGGAVVQGERKVFSEFAMHRAVYAVREDVAVVLHAHPPHATGWAVAGESFFDPPFMAEVDAVLLGNHGVLTVGPDIETAVLRMELVEHLARIALVARQVGGARAIPETSVDALLAARKKAGLGPRASRSFDAGVAGPSVGGGSEPDVAAVVREALRRLG